MKYYTEFVRVVSLKMNSNVYPLKTTISHYLLHNITTIPPHKGKMSLTFCEGSFSCILTYQL